MTQELTQKIETALNGLETFKTDLLKKAEKFDTFDQTKFDKIEKSIGDAIEASQAAKQAAEAKNKALEDEITAIKTAMNRPGAPATLEDKSKEAKLKFKKAINEFARFDTGRQGMYFDDYVKQQHPDDAELKALSVGSDPSGGYLVTPEMGGIIQTKVYESSPLRTLASVQSIGSLSYEYVTDNDEAGSGWVGETGARPATNTPTLGKITITAHELYANPKATQTVLDDASIDMEAWLAGKVADKFARDEATAFVSGSGIAKPRGFLSYAAGTDIAQEQIEQIASGAASTFTFDGLVDLQNSLKEPYQANARFLIRRASNATLMKIKDGQGHPIFNMTFDKNMGLQPTIMGKPVAFAADMPAVQAAALAAAYGDFKAGYLIVDRIGLRVLRDPYTDKPYVSFYTTKRVGGAVINFEAIKLQKIAAA